MLGCACCSTYQFVVFVLYLKPGSDAVPRVDEGFTLGPVRDVVQKDAGDVDAQKDDAVGHQLEGNGNTYYEIANNQLFSV